MRFLGLLVGLLLLAGPARADEVQQRQITVYELFLGRPAPPDYNPDNDRLRNLLKSLIPELDALGIKTITENFQARPSLRWVQSMAWYAAYSPDVTVVVSERNFPLLDEPEADRDSVRLLLGGFLAGNLQAQLASGRAEDRSYEGVLSMLRVYRLLPDFNSPGLNELALMEVRGQLRDYLTSPR